MAIPLFFLLLSSTFSSSSPLPFLHPRLFQFLSSIPLPFTLPLIFLSFTSFSSIPVPIPFFHISSLSFTLFLFLSSNFFSLLPLQLPLRCAFLLHSLHLPLSLFYFFLFLSFTPLLSSFSPLPLLLLSLFVLSISFQPLYLLLFLLFFFSTSSLLYFVPSSIYRPPLTLPLLYLLFHCYNRKVCLPVIPGEGAVSFKTVWFFPINISPEAEGKISTNPH
jgi:hypothetical protein